MFKTIFIMLTVLLLCGAVGAADSTQVEKKNKILVGSGVAIEQGWETSATSSVAYSRSTNVEGGVFAMLVPDESFVVYQYAALENEKSGEETKVKSTSIMGIWKVGERAGFRPFVSLSGVGSRVTSQSTSSNEFDVNLGFGTYFEITEGIGLYMNNVFEVGELSKYKGTVGLYITR